MKKLLLITPKSFYVFHKFIANEFEKRGYEVSISNDEYPESFWGKVMGTLELKIGWYITEKNIVNNFLNGNQYDLILIFKGRGMSPSLINKMKSVSERIIGYTYDSIKYYGSPLKWKELLNEFYTFDIADSKKYNIPLLELFTCIPDNIIPIENRDIDLSVIMRNHSNRLVFLDEILSANHFQNQFIFIFEKDFVTFFVNFIRNPLLYIKYWKYIHFKSLDYATVCDVLRRSKFSLDFAHPKQSGLTMRSFEAASMGTKLITNNVNIFQSAFYGKDDAIVYKIGGDKDLLKVQIIEKSKTIYNVRKRSLSNFVDDLLSV